MPLKLSHQKDGKVLEVQVLGKLTHADYQECIAEFERLRKKRGKLRVLYDLANFHGWETAALWDELKFDAKHFADIERMAAVGDKTWEKWMTEFFKPFTAATVRYFEHNEIDAARAWLSEA